jgi:hypothetical protein
MRAFADALDAVPMALAENSGLSPIETLANIKSRQAKEKNTRLGVDCMQTGSNGKSRSPPHVSLYCHSARTLPFVSTIMARIRSAQFPLSSPPLLTARSRNTTGCAYLRGPVVHTSSRVSTPPRDVVLCRPPPTPSPHSPHPGIPNAATTSEYWTVHSSNMAL